MSKSNGEEVVWRGRPSRRGVVVHYPRLTLSFIAISALAILLAIVSLIATGWAILAVAAAFLIMALWVWLTRKTTAYTITDTSISENFGILVRKREQARIAQVTNITIIRNIPERLLGIGRVDVDTANDSNNILQWYGISDPSEIENIINRERSEIIDKV